MTPSNAMFAYAAYAAVWIVLFGYLLLLARRLTQFEAELHDVAATARPPEAVVDTADPAPPPALAGWQPAPAVRQPIAAAAGDRAGG
jgi:CcmD family protein